MSSVIEKVIHSVKDRNIKRYLDNQKDSIEADFLLLEKSGQKEVLDHLNSSDIVTLLANITIPQLWTTELLILSKLDSNSLVRRVWLIRQKFRSLCGDEVYKNYHDNSPVSIQDQSLTANAELQPEQLTLLRDDILSIVRQMQRLVYVRICRSESINERKRFVIQTALIIGLIGFSIFWLLKLGVIPIEPESNRVSLKFLLLIIGSGITGTTVSLLQRIEKATNIPPLITDTVHDATQITHNMSNWYVASLLVSGAVFALLIYLIAVSQLVNVLDILPSPDSMKSTTENDALLIMPPNNKADTAKLLLACFLSGFAERLVPDILDNLIKAKIKTA